MTVTLRNVSRAVQNIDAHREFAYAAEMMGDSKTAAKHKRYADAIMRDVLAVTEPRTTLSGDDLLSELMA